MILSNYLKVTKKCVKQCGRTVQQPSVGFHKAFLFTEGLNLLNTHVYFSTERSNMISSTIRDHSTHCQWSLHLNHDNLVFKHKLLFLFFLTYSLSKTCHNLTWWWLYKGWKYKLILTLVQQQSTLQIHITNDPDISIMIIWFLMTNDTKDKDCLYDNRTQL